jgi:purine-binding chemotaxis protein CheW
VPGVAAHWAGVVNLRGRLYPVLDLRRHLNLQAGTATDGGQIVLVAAAKLEVALWSADVLGVRHVPHDEIQPTLVEMHGVPRNLIAGVTADLLSVLDLDALLGDPKLAVQGEG